MGMRIAFDRKPVRRPAGMPYADGGEGVCRFRNFFFQIAKFSLRTDDFQFIKLQKSQTCRIITAVFQTLQPLQHKRNSRSVPAVTDNSAHN